MSKITHDFSKSTKTQKDKANKILEKLDNQVIQANTQSIHHDEQVMKEEDVEKLQRFLDNKLNDYEAKMQDKVKDTYFSIYENTK